MMDKDTKDEGTQEIMADVPMKPLEERVAIDRERIKGTRNYAKDARFYQTAGSARASNALLDKMAANVEAQGVSAAYQMGGFTEMTDEEIARYNANRKAMLADLRANPPDENLESTQDDPTTVDWSDPNPTATPLADLKAALRKMNSLGLTALAPHDHTEQEMMLAQRLFTLRMVEDAIYTQRTMTPGWFTALNELAQYLHPIPIYLPGTAEPKLAAVYDLWDVPFQVTVPTLRLRSLGATLMDSNQLPIYSDREVANALLTVKKLRDTLEAQVEVGGTVNGTSEDPGVPSLHPVEDNGGYEAYAGAYDAGMTPELTDYENTVIAGMCAAIGKAQEVLVQVNARSDEGAVAAENYRDELIEYLVQFIVERASIGAQND